METSIKENSHCYTFFSNYIHFISQHVADISVSFPTLSKISTHTNGGGGADRQTDRDRKTDRTAFYSYC